MRKTVFIALLALWCAHTQAQDEAVEEVIVSGIMDSGEYYEMPAVTLKKQGDFLVQDVKIVNDSRASDLREKEIRESLQALAESASKQGNIQLAYGDEFLRSLDPKDKSLVFLKDGSRADTSYFNFSVKQKINQQLSAQEQEAALEKFIKSAKKVGRTELDLKGEADLSIVTPEKYRYEVIQKIAEENTRLRQAIGQSCDIQLDGISNRVKWQRSGITELVIYIPYRTQLLCKQN